MQYIAKTKKSIGYKAEMIAMWPFFASLALLYSPQKLQFVSIKLNR